LIRFDNEMKRKPTKPRRQLNIKVIRGQVLGVTVLRGYAKLSDLALISKADVYDQKRNPTGTQRDLSPKHAREAYEYVKTHDLGFWSEVFLCARNKKVIKFEPSARNSEIGTLKIDLELATNPNSIAISRVDGIHRLHYADGKESVFTPIEKSVSFCLAYNLSLEQEIVLFRDINANQKAMNTSHLDNIEARLTGEDQLKRQEPDLYIARTLGQDTASPFYDRVFEGGKKVAGAIIPLRSLRTGISYMLSRPTKLTALRDADAQYKVIRNYFRAVKRWQSDAWAEPSRYLLLRGAGLWGVCFIGSEVIDRVLAQGKFSTEEMLKVLKSGKDWDWSYKGDFQGYSGRGGALKISNNVTAEFQDGSGMSVKALFGQIMREH
jgi:DGQHR domain-containing protein